MADVLTDPEAIKKVTAEISYMEEKLKQLKPLIGQVNESFTATSNTLNLVSNSTANQTSQIGILRSEYERLIPYTKMLESSTSDATQKHQQFNTVVNGAAVSLAVLGVKAIGVSSEMSKMAETSLVGSASLSTYSQRIDEVSKSVDAWLQKPGDSQTKSLFQKIAGGAKGAIEAFLKSKIATDQYKSGLYALYSQTGQLNDLTKAGGDIHAALSAKMTGTEITTKNLGNAMGLTKDEVLGMYKEIMKLSMDGFEKFDGSTGKTFAGLTRLQAAEQMAMGTTGDFKDAQALLGREFSEFGEDTAKPLEHLAMMSKVSHDLRIPFKALSDAAMSSSDHFRYFGNNIEGTIGTLGNFVNALKQVGVGYKQATEIGQKFLSGVGELTIAQKAFLSSQTGGAGGLRGAFQIEDMLAKGQVDQVVQKVQETFRKQFGSNVVTREQATQSDSAAQQYMKQLMIFTDGPLGKFAKNTDDAAKFMEAFKSGNLSGVLSSKLKNEATAEAMTRGAERTKDRVSPMVEAMNETDTIKNLTTQKRGEMVGQYLGKGNTATMDRHKELLEKERLIPAMHTVTDEWIKSGKVMDNLNRTMIGSFKNGVDIAGAAVNTLGVAIKNITNDLKKFGESAAAAFGQQSKQQDKPMQLPITLIIENMGKQTTVYSKTSEPGKKERVDATGVGTIG